jgi:hypothetical protein
MIRTATGGRLQQKEAQGESTPSETKPFCGIIKLESNFCWLMWEALGRLETLGSSPLHAPPGG